LHNVGVLLLFSRFKLWASGTQWEPPHIIKKTGLSNSVKNTKENRIAQKFENIPNVFYTPPPSKGAPRALGSHGWPRRAAGRVMVNLIFYGEAATDNRSLYKNKVDTKPGAKQLQHNQFFT
jgi:hypothetical protein